MKLVEYDKNLHEYLFIELLSKRKMPDNYVLNLPELGLVVFEDSRVVCMGFLRKIEGNLGMLDGYITNPEMDSSKRHEALDLMTKEFKKLGQKLQMTHFFSFTVDEGIFNRAKRHGFKDPGLKFMVMNLNR